MGVVDIGNYLVFVLYLAVAYKSSVNFKNAPKANLYGTIQMLVYAFSFVTFMQATTFMILQVEWILERNNDVVTDVASWGWMFYDYFNGFALLMFTLIIETYMGWRIPEFGGKAIPIHRKGEEEDHSIERQHP